MNKFLKVLDYFFLIFSSILLILLLFAISVLPIAKSKRYYMNQHEKNGVEKILEDKTFNGYKHYHFENGKKINCYYPLYDVTNEDIENATEHIIDYLYSNKVESMQFSVNTSEGEVEFFSEQAIIHMKDVKVLFIGGIKLTYICIALFILSVIYLVFRKNEIKGKVLKIYTITVGCFFLIVIGVFIFAMSDFNKAFEVFHQIIFPDAEKVELALTFTFCDTLTNVLTENFFMNIGMTMGITFIVLLTLSIVIMILVKKYQDKIISWFKKKNEKPV